MDEITIIGGGLAGVEAAWQVLQRQGRVRLFEMKPVRFSPAHKSEKLAELVCSNSLKSMSSASASGLLKAEMKLLGSLLMEAAESFRVPAGQALAVDRERFSSCITERLVSHPGFELVREEVVRIPEAGTVIIATGPLTSEALAMEIERLTGSSRLYFYDAIAPVVFADSIDMQIVFRASRYGRGGDDYLNCPLTREEYERFHEQLLKAETVPLREFEQARFFEGCLPVEEMARRGKDTLAFGPMKPVGLRDPRTGREPYAVVQLRQEDICSELYGMVGFQTRLRYPEQERIFRSIPGLSRAVFARLGSMHRNTYLDSPRLLAPDFSLRQKPMLFFAGQLTGVEGYLESAATGMAAGIFALLKSRGMEPRPIPRESALGSLVRYVTTAGSGEFSPMNVNFGLLPPLAGKVPRRLKNQLLSERALKSMAEYADWLNSKLPLK
jgi:methylenetetrahydrofolate--tRNA-(uracil-5-)-methyltransferase